MISIKIVGPGQTFDGEFLAIKSALEGLGCKVEIDNPYPPRPEMVSGNFRHKKVKIEVVHLPWREE